MSDIQQVDWLSVREAPAVTFQQAFIELPAFDAVDTQWVGASEIYIQYGFSASKNFTIPRVTTKPTDVNFCLCIRYRVGDVVYRYKLWEDVGEVLSSVNLYNGEVIKKNFVLEIWSIEDGTSVSLDEASEFFLSIRKIPTDYRDLSAYEDCEGEYINPLVSANNVGLPSDVTPLYRLDAGEGIQLSGSDVASWTDQVAGYVLGNAAPVVYPTFSDSVAEIIYKPCVNFIANADIYELAATHFTDKIMFCVFKLTTWVSGQQLFKSGANFVEFQTIANRIENKYSGSAQNPAISLTLGTWYIGMFYTEALSAGLRPVRMYVEKLDDDNTVAIDQTINVADAVTTNVLTMGIALQTRVYSIAEMFGYTTLTPSQISQVLVYLRSKYHAGITIPIDFPVGSPWLDNE